jgi:F-type H+-transporting ATPase subunit a
MSPLLLSVLTSEDITVGEHPRATIFGLTINQDTVISTLVAAGVLLAAALWMRFTVSDDGVPGKLQLGFEALV